MDETLKFFEENKFVAVIRTSSNEDAEEMLKAVTTGGIKILEIAMTIPQATRLIESWSKKEGLLVGAGTVTDGEMAQRAINAGAKFVSSHYTDRDVINVAKNNNTFIIQGAATPTEAVNAWQLGVDLIKIYPIEFYGGPNYLSTLKGPLPFLKLMASGEITLENAFDYLKYACAVALNRAFFDKALIRSNNWQEITERTRQLTQKLEALKVSKNPS
ncbi:MAG: bifunctional 4-hydroxy-2-oxoglutarate aldolase/2-dehydro-3-deoxy-phosphogluconate aldolase [Candidatus Omnitrophica bacterium]|nr:bifunctional 4-hydroxy-2-oxoglutarate aldolase/2-dehydro-3-deoxy-phosphogluconate aldolase [Candidatus Omnitrophota bacterium]